MMRRVTLTMTAAGAAVVMLAGCGGNDPVSQATPAAGRTPSSATEQAAQGADGDASSSNQSDRSGDGAEAAGASASTSGGEDGSSDGGGDAASGEGGASSGGEGGTSSGGDDSESSGGDGGASDRGAPGGSPEPTPPPVEDPPTGPEEGTAGSSGSAAIPTPLATIRHGGDYWAVLWVDGSSRAPLNDIRQAISDRWGAVWMDGDIGCNRGAADALGVGAHQRAVSVHFDTEAKARRFATNASLGAAPTGYAQVTTYCLD